MTRVDLDDLRAKAEACGGASSARVLSLPHRSGLFDVLTEPDGAEIYERCTIADAEYAVASQPAVVLALLDRLRNVERAAQALIDAGMCRHANCEEGCPSTDAWNDLSAVLP